MRRVVVIGNSGGDKSTLARRLASRFACPLHAIDMPLRVHFRLAAEAGGAETTRITALAAPDAVNAGTE